MQLNQGLLFGIDNLAWAAGQGIAAAAGGAIAEATTDLVPYGLLAAACLASLLALGPARRRLAARLLGAASAAGSAPAVEPGDRGWWRARNRVSL